MTWLYKNEIVEEIADKYIGFVYIITNLVTGKQYIGKKLTKHKKTKQVKGKKKKILKESDWKNYYGSSDALKEDIEKLGKENFKREILHLCLSKGTCNYFECKEQFVREVLENPDKWYNGYIMCRINSTHLKLDNPN